MFDFAEFAQCWSRVVQIMSAQNFDVVLAGDSSRDEILLSSQRWLTGFTPLGGPAAALVFRDGHVESGLPIETIAGFSPALFVERMAQVDARRIGYAEGGSFPAGLYSALQGMAAPPALIDISSNMIRLRLQKTAAELQAIRKSCAIADKIAGRLKDIFTPDRWFYEVVADIEHIARLEGAEGGFFLISRLPIFGIPMRVLADPEIIQPGQRYMVEISPRYDGYYSQLTLPVTTRADDGIIGSAYADIITAKQSAQKLMLPGADLTNISVQLKAFFAERGHVMAPSLGHFCGLALEEPRHDPSQPFLLEEGMSFIFHPVLAHPELNSLMRADTYVITPDGAERLNKFPMEMVKIG